MAKLLQQGSNFFSGAYFSIADYPGEPPWTIMLSLCLLMETSRDRSRAGDLRQDPIVLDGDNLNLIVTKIFFTALEGPGPGKLAERTDVETRTLPVL